MSGPAGVLVFVAAVILVIAGVIFFRRHEKELEERAEVAIARSHGKGPREARSP